VGQPWTEQETVFALTPVLSQALSVTGEETGRLVSSEELTAVGKETVLRLAPVLSQALSVTGEETRRLVSSEELTAVGKETVLAAPAKGLTVAGKGVGPGSGSAVLSNELTSAGMDKGSRLVEVVPKKLTLARRETGLVPGLLWHELTLAGTEKELWLVAVAPQKLALAEREKDSGLVAVVPKTLTLAGRETGWVPGLLWHELTSAGKKLVLVAVPKKLNLAGKEADLMLVAVVLNQLSVDCALPQATSSASLGTSADSPVPLPDTQSSPQAYATALGRRKTAARVQKRGRRESKIDRL
jgi:hypothetical protein